MPSRMTNLTGFVQELQTAETVHQQLAVELRALQVLQRYTKADRDKISVDSAVHAVSADRKQFEVLRAESAATQSALRAHEIKGWTFKRLVELSTAAGIRGPVGVGSFEGARSTVRAEQVQENKALQKVEDETADTRARLTKIGARLAKRKRVPRTCFGSCRRGSVRPMNNVQQ